MIIRTKTIHIRQTSISNFNFGNLSSSISTER